MYPNIHRDQEAGVSVLASSFLTHLTENGRMIGLLLEKLEGEFASTDDIPACEEARRRLYLMGMVLGDVNLYNFIFDGSKTRVQLVDFENTGPYDEPKTTTEL